MEGIMSTKEKILDAALTLFAENGYDGTSAEQISLWSMNVVFGYRFRKCTCPINNKLWAQIGTGMFRYLLK